MRAGIPLEIVPAATEQEFEAAIAAFAQIGRGNEHDADQAAVEAMRAALNVLPIDGTVVIGGGHLATPYRDRNETVLDWDKLAISARTVWELFPVMREATIVRAWAGIEAYMPDGIPVVGRSSTSEGVFHQFGFSTHGFQLGPGTGAMMAELVATGSTNVPIDGLEIGRFAAQAARQS